MKYVYFVMIENKERDKETFIIRTDFMVTSANDLKRIHNNLTEGSNLSEHKYFTEANSIITCINFLHEVIE